MSLLLPLLAATVMVPQGLDSRHIPLGSPLGDMPIVMSPGESPQQLQKPMTEAQFWAERRAAIARAEKTPRGRAIARRLAEIERQTAAEDAAAAAKPDPY